MRGITAAQPTWNEQGEAYIAAFDDHYFSTEDGAAESHHVFVEGNISSNASPIPVKIRSRSSQKSVLAPALMLR